jgi:hypothetical protein
MNVVATAPMPGRSTPSFPPAGAMSRPFPAVVMSSPPVRRFNVDANHRS